MTETAWYVVRTKPRNETRAAEHLARQGFSIYLPRYLKRRRHARRTDTVLAPLFPSYLFVSFNILRDRWTSIRSTLGVVNLISRDSAPVPVPAGIVDGIRKQEDDRGFIRLIKRCALRPGEKVVITAGAFVDQIGLLANYSDDERVTVLLSLLGRSTTVTFPLDCIAPAA